MAGKILQKLGYIRNPELMRCSIDYLIFMVVNIVEALPQTPFHYFSLIKRNKTKKNQDKINLGVFSMRP